MIRFSFALFCLFIGLFLSVQEIRGQDDAWLKKKTVSELEQRLKEIDTELEQLASYHMRTDIGSTGYESESHKQSNVTEWIRIELGEEAPIDQVVLVPTIRRNRESKLQAEGFPLEFRILAGTANTTNIVSTFKEEDPLLPRIAPLVVSFKPVNASWIGIEATVLSKRYWSSKHALQFSEVMVFSGAENVAHGKPVSARSGEYRYNPRHERFLVDGFVPYIIDSAIETTGMPLRFRTQDKYLKVSFTVDLQKPLPVNQINIHSSAKADLIPGDIPNDFGIPIRFRVLGSARPDFNDAVILFEFHRKSAYESGPVIIRRFPQATCQYVRLDILELAKDEFAKRGGFACIIEEFEILSHGKNVAAGKPTTITGWNPSRPPLAPRPLTDECNYYGKILPVKVWMNQLARRHELEAERPLVAADLNRRYARQKRILSIMSWLAVLLGSSTFFIILLSRSMRQRAVFQTREQIAANLHDELGANLHAIRLFSALAKDKLNSEEGNAECSKLVDVVDQINTLTEHAANTTRFCTNMLEAAELYENLPDEIRRTAQRLLADLKYDITMQGEDMLRKLQSSRRVGLLLFYKECLANIIRHSGATEVQTDLTVNGKKICLTVLDNGKGVEEPPPSLKRRARLLKAQLSVESSPDSGSKITLILKL
ncbi:hypothetical protein BVX97_01040 [bacterium E08(2017)]|nr:hypothetical protein BVX97_01040 [bacterium E08(2017)]